MDNQASHTPVPAGGSEGKDALTCIHVPIHCAAADEPDGGEDDLQQIDVRNFIDALAEIALAVARRRQELEL